MNDKIIKYLIAFLIIFRFILAFFYPVFSDSTRYFYECKIIASNPLLLLSPIYYYPPLFYVFGASLYFVIGELGLKLISPLFGSIAIFYTYKLGKILFNERVGLISALFFSLIPIHIYLSSVGYMDSLVTGLMIMFLYYFYVYVTSGKGFWVVCFVAFLCSFSKITGVLVFVFAVLCLIISKPNKEAIKKIGMFLVVGGLFSSIYYIRNYLLFKNFLFNVSGYKELSNLIVNFDTSLINQDFNKLVVYTYDKSFINYVSEIFLDFWGVPQGHIGNISFLNPFLVSVFLIVISGITIFVLVMILRRFNFKSNLYLMMWLLTWVFAALLFGDALFMGFRRFLPVASVLAILVGYSLNMLDKKKLMVIFIMLLVISVPSQTYKLIYANNYYNSFSDSMKFIKGLPDNSVILTPYIEENAYYTEKKSMSLSQLNPLYLNETTLKRYGINYIVTSNIYVWFNMTESNKIVESMGLNVVYSDKNIKVYEVREIKKV